MSKPSKSSNLGNSSQCRKTNASDPMLKKVSQKEVQPWHRLGGMEHICELRKSSSVLYGILVTILRMLYTSKKGRTFGCPDVVWSEDPEKTQLWIDTQLRWEDQRPDFYPAIYVNLGDIQYSVPPTLDLEGRSSISNDGEQSYSRTGICTASIVHVCDTAGEACALADNTENYLSSLQDQIKDEYCFSHFLVTGRTPLQKKEQNQTAGKDKMVSIVQIKFDWDDAWTVKLETPILKSVNVIDENRSSLCITGTNVDIMNGEVEIEFGNMSSATDTPVDD